MSPSHAHVHDDTPHDTCIALAHALGYLDYPASSTAEPYLNYVSNRHIGRGSLQDYLALFIRVIEHFDGANVIKARVNGTPTPNSIQSLLDKLICSEDVELFADTKAGSQMRKGDVEDTVLYIMGVWTMMLSSFVQLPNGLRKVTAAYIGRAEARNGSPYGETLASLVKGSGLLPSQRESVNEPDIQQDDEIVRTAMKLVALLSSSKDAASESHLNAKGSFSTNMFENMKSKHARSHISYQSLDDMDSLESLSIKATRLNAFTLNVLGAVDIMWTHNVSRHMLLSRYCGRYVIEVFALPCVFNGGSLTSEAIGIPSDLAQEIQESYCILFNAWPNPRLHTKLGRFLGIRQFCWCWSCSAYRYRSKAVSKLKKDRKPNTQQLQGGRNTSTRSEFDPQLVHRYVASSKGYTLRYSLTILQ